MSPRARQVAMGMIFWLAFAPAALLTILLQPLLILIYAVGNDHIRDWIYRTGKAIDQLDNASIFGGHPKETISSHTGRWLLDTSGRPIPLKFRFVNWLTNLFEKDHCIKAIEEPFKNLPL